MNTNEELVAQTEPVTQPEPTPLTLSPELQQQSQGQVRQNATHFNLTLSVPEQRELFAGLFEHIGEVHLAECRKDLIEFTKEYRNRRKKGIVLLHYADTKEMIQSVKHKKFLYVWIGENEARQFKHSGVQTAVTTMNPHSDCVLAASLQLGTNHIHMNCYKLTKIIS